MTDRVHSSEQPVAKFYSLSEKELFREVLDTYKAYSFEVKKTIDTESDLNLKLYDIDYFRMHLNALENFEEGEFTLANKLRFRRYYVTNTTYTDGMYTYLTEVVDSTALKYKGSIAMVHGAAQCHDVFFETAIQFALNGFCVHLVDLEGHGFSGGNRINKMSIEKFHHQVVTLLEQARPDIPLFLFGHSMGGLTVASFLGRNK